MTHDVWTVARESFDSPDAVALWRECYTHMSDSWYLLKENRRTDPDELEREIAADPGTEFAPPGGALVIARHAGVAAGMAGVRLLDDPLAGGVRTGDVPKGDAQTGDVPTGAVGTGEVPTGAVGTGEVPAGDVWMGEVPAGGVWMGEVPAGGVRTGGVATSDDVRAELKRVYLRPEFRGRGGAELIVRAAEDEARRLGASRMVLETRSDFVAARALYKRLGYDEIEPYTFAQYSEHWFGKEL
jgi:GNAT superfamily N-acetyltransferase